MLLLRYSVWYLPGRSTTKQTLTEFPVCANVAVLLCLEILLQAYEKHTEKLNFFFSNFDLEYHTARNNITSCFSAYSAI